MAKFYMTRYNYEDQPKETVYIKYLPDAHKLEQVDWGSWIDLYTYEPITIKQGERAYINLGIAMQLPEGYEAIIAPRSSTFKSWGVLQTNSIGVIDSTYCGDNDIWMFPAYATKTVTIPANTRICQFRIQKEQPELLFEEVETLEAEDRGGFGSSGL